MKRADTLPELVERSASIVNKLKTICEAKVSIIDIADALVLWALVTELMHAKEERTMILLDEEIDGMRAFIRVAGPLLREGKSQAEVVTIIKNRFASEFN